jgi:hypothetical protein
MACEHLKEMKGKLKKVANWLREWTGVVTVILTLIVVGFSCMTVQKAKETLEAQEEIVNWYKNPKPLLQTWTNVDNEIQNGSYTVWRWKQYSPDKGLNSPTGIFSNARITLYIYNAGRSPVTGGYLKLRIENYTTPRSLFPFPFKITNVTTPLDWTDFNTFTKQFDGRWKAFQVNMLRVNDFPPTWGSDEKLYYRPDFPVGAIAPGQKIEINVGLFSSQNNATGELWLSIEFDGGETIKQVIPLESGEAKL